MASITQDMRYRLSLIQYTEKFSATKAAVKYKTHQQYIYRWKHRYDGLYRVLFVAVPKGLTIISTSTHQKKSSSSTTCAD